MERKSSAKVSKLLFFTTYSAAKTGFPPFHFSLSFDIFFPSLFFSLALTLLDSLNSPLRLKPAGCSGYHTVETIQDKDTLLSHAHGTGYTEQGGEKHPDPIIYNLLLANYKAQIVQMGMETIATSCIIFFFYSSWFFQLH